MELIIRFERNEIERVFTGAGMVFTHLMNRPRPIPVDAPTQLPQIDAAGVIQGEGGQAGPELRSMADVFNFLSGLRDDGGRPLLPPHVQGQHQCRYVYLQTEHGEDIYVCAEESCERKLAIPGQIITPAPVREIPEVREDEGREREQPKPPGLPPGESEEATGEDAPPE